MSYYGNLSGRAKLVSFSWHRVPCMALTQNSPPVRGEVLGAGAWSSPSSCPSALQLGDFGECLVSKYLR